MTSVNRHRRLDGETYDIALPVGEGQLALKLTLARDESGAVQEIAFTGRGKSGQGLDQMFVDLGIQISRAIQARDPATGEQL